MNELIPLLVLRIATALAGIAFLTFTAQAYRRYRTRALAILGVAIGLMVVGVMLEGISFFIFGASLGTAETLEAAVVLAAFLVLLWSVRSQTDD